MPFEFEKLSIPEAVHIKPKRFEDSRGFFSELYHIKAFEQAGIKSQIVQINFSKSSKGVLRGLHYQLAPYAQGKIVRVAKGEIFDVAVDLRKNSQTFGKWVGVNLSSEKYNMLYIPEGFAHGFEVLSETAEFEYFCTAVYAPEHERGIIYNDAFLNISWNTKNPSVSEKDSKFPPFKEAEYNF
ncbi:MAG: dTDP-4-dehydrorhamnose 3,5-epimerase [Endomicrobia bacterium]|nr:dTDP-4-dehydrorhamnose 3,5-epimerase [Endomicrobiia bacterium]